MSLRYQHWWQSFKNPYTYRPELYQDLDMRDDFVITFGYRGSSVKVWIIINGALLTVVNSELQKWFSIIDITYLRFFGWSELNSLIPRNVLTGAFGVVLFNIIKPADGIAKPTTSGAQHQPQGWECLSFLVAEVFPRAQDAPSRCAGDGRSAAYGAQVRYPGTRRNESYCKWLDQRYLIVILGYCGKLNASEINYLYQWCLVGKLLGYLQHFITLLLFVIATLHHDE